MSYTPGPWSIPHLSDFSGDGCDCAYVCSEGYAGSICKISVGNGLLIGEGGNDSPPIEEAQANGRLIAAAPDLLEALKSLYEMSRHEGESSSDMIERLSGIFERDTGYLIPAKDCCVTPYETRKKAFDEWVGERTEKARAAIARATPPAKG